LFDAEYDLKGNLLLPGFKNAHAHSPMTFLRSFADDLPLDKWLQEQIFPNEAKLTPEDVYYLYKLAVLEYLSGGITSAFDMYFFTAEMGRAAKDTGFRGVFCGSINDFSGSVELLENEFLTLNDYCDRVTFHLGFHAEYTCSESLLKQVAALSHKYRAPVFFHSSETASEVEGCRERHGMTPTAYLDSLGMFEYGGGAFHCVHVTSEDIAIMRRKNVSAVTNPASNCKLASGIAPVRDMMDAGMFVGIGTDGPASNNALDMFREMYLVSSLQRILLGDASAMDANEALSMAVKNSAVIMNLDDCTGLAEGMLADLIVIDLFQPNMRPKNDVIKNAVYAGGKQNVLLTMVNGRILYEDGEYYIGQSVEEIYEKAEEIITRIAK
jgi:5-methylthioadenosine/S-adenosylhomocysteine deaminase